MATTTRGRWASPERTMVWTEPPPKTATTTRAPLHKVSVVYYLSRNGQLDHPHFMEVALSDPHHGLFLRDVLHRLNLLRGDGIADRYSWSSKRTYKNGYVWHDLTPDDLVRPAHGDEYVLKGSELLLLLAPPGRPRDPSAASSSSSSSGCRQLQDTKNARARKNWSSFDLGEYRVAVRGGSDVDLCAADAATQTDDRRGRLRVPEPTTELGIDEISPPPSSSSPETLETLIKNDARVAATTAAPQCEVTAAARGRKEEVGVNVIAGGRMRASAVLMQLISCGSVTVKDTPQGYTERRRLPRGRSDMSCRAADSLSGSSITAGGYMEREYFSGSLVETKKTTTTCDVNGVGDHAGTGELKRSSSYNADRCRGVVVDTNTGRDEEEPVDGSSSRCIPRKPKPLSHSPSTI